MTCTSEWGIVAIALLGGAIGLLNSWCLWRKSASIKPGMHLYRLFEVSYHVWPPNREKNFRKVTEKYLKHWARVSLVLGIQMTILGVGGVYIFLR